jgi:hypothetical protein
MNPLPCVIVLTESVNMTITTPGGVYVIDKNTGKVIKFIPEMPLDRRHQQLETITSGIEVLENTRDLRGTEELRARVGRYLVGAVQTVASEANPTIRGH